MKIIISLLIFFFATFTVRTASGAESILIGVLEQPQCKQESTLVVRVLFAKVGDDWLPLIDNKSAKPFELSNVTWTAAFNGQRIGSFQTTDTGFHSNYEWTYPRDKFLEVVAGQSVPKITNHEKNFSGWCSPPAYSPIVVVSYPNFNDPAEWNSFSPGNNYKQQLFSTFSGIVGEARRCLYEPTYHSVPYSYTADELVLFKGYKDKFGHKLVSLGLDLEIINCDGPPESTNKPNWFIVNEQPRHIGNELEMIDAGDYDNDGRSELLFWHGGYNEDGYTLFYDDFKKRVNFYWNYH